MSKNTKLLVLELDYELKDAERSDDAGNITPYAAVTRNLINMAFQQNHQPPVAQGMDNRTAKAWRSIRKQLDSAVDDDKKGYLLLAESDFDSIYEEVYKCKYMPAQALISPYLCDELDKVKHRSAADEEKLQEGTLKLEADVEHEMEKRDQEQLGSDEGGKDVVKRTLEEVTQKSEVEKSEVEKVEKVS